MGQSFGSLVYDIPVSENKVRSKLLKMIRRVAIPMSWSCFLLPWSLREEVKKILAEIESDKPNIVNSYLFKFDDSEEKVLEAAARKSFDQMIKRTHDLLLKRLTKAETEQKELEEKVKEVSATKNRKTSDTELEKMREFARDNFELMAKKSLSQAEKSLKEGRRLAVLFALSSCLEFAFEGLESLIKHQREAFQAKLETQMAEK